VIGLAEAARLTPQTLAALWIAPAQTPGERSRLHELVRTVLTGAELEQAGRDAVACRTTCTCTCTSADVRVVGTRTSARPTAEKEPRTMAIEYHEDVTVYTAGVMHKPLTGRPAFAGMLDHPDGPIARIIDGDLVFSIDDIAVLTRWRQVFEQAEHQMRLAHARQERRS